MWAKKGPVPPLQASSPDYKHPRGFMTFRQEMERPQGTTSNHHRSPHQSFIWPKVRLLGSPKCQIEIHAARKATCPTHLSAACSLKYSQARTPLKRLHVQDAAPPKNGTWKRANRYSRNEPISAQETSQSVLRKRANQCSECQRRPTPISSRAFPTCSRSRLRWPHPQFYSPSGPLGLWVRERLCATCL